MTVRVGIIDPFVHELLACRKAAHGWMEGWILPEFSEFTASQSQSQRLCSLSCYNCIYNQGERTQMCKSCSLDWKFLSLDTWALSSVCDLQVFRSSVCPLCSGHETATRNGAFSEDVAAAPTVQLQRQWPWMIFSFVDDDDGLDLRARWRKWSLSVSLFYCVQLGCFKVSPEQSSLIWSISAISL